MKQEQQIPTRNKNMTDEELCRLIIALANLVYIENGSHDIKFVKEKT